MPLFTADPRIEQRQLHIFLNSELGDQVVLLENESQHPVANLRLLIVSHGGHVNAPQVIGAGGGDVQAADDVHGRGLTGTGLAYDGHELSLVDGKAHAVQGVDLLVTHGVDLVNVLQFNQMPQGHQPPITPVWLSMSTVSPASRPEVISM